MAAAPSDFFKTTRTPSEIKGELLPRLFEVWAITMLQDANAAKLPMQFLDLLVGLDSSEPVPSALQLLRQVYKSSGTRTDLNKSISTVFFDVDKSALAELQEKVVQLPFYQDLVHPPVLLQEEEGDEALSAQVLEVDQPILAFLDPTIEGIPQQVLLRAAQAGTPDLFMLYDPKILDNAIRKAKADSILGQIFGERLEQVKAFYKQNRNADRREGYLLDSFEEIFRIEGTYTLCFKISHPDKKQTAYYLVLATRSEEVYIRQKELLERYSDYQEDGVPLFGTNLQAQQMSLFHEHYTYSIANLVQELSQKAADFSNRTVQYVYEQHSIGMHYSLANYQTAYDKLMRQGLVRFINPKTGQPISKITPTSLIRYKK